MIVYCFEKETVSNPCKSCISVNGFRKSKPSFSDFHDLRIPNIQSYLSRQQKQAFFLFPISNLKKAFGCFGSVVLVIRHTRENNSYLAFCRFQTSLSIFPNRLYQSFDDTGTQIPKLVKKWAQKKTSISVKNSEKNSFIAPNQASLAPPTPFWPQTFR